jgi:hypothetical protein
MVQLPYFSGHSWNNLTREERFYCFNLYEHARIDPTDFARWVAETAEPKFSIKGENEWDIGVEVCFYRDLLWHGRRSAKAEDLPFKRTFDLCLFGPRTIIIIEAKAFEGFNSTQNRDFAKDAARIGELPGLKDIKVVLVALASSKYYKAMEKYGDEETLAFFNGRISWAQVFEKYQDKLLLQADQLYKSKIHRLSL